MKLYILNKYNQVEKCEDSNLAVLSWQKNKIIKQEKIKNKSFMLFQKEVMISTVFLGINHNWGKDAERHPILFETMVFGGKYGELQQRYETYNEAVNGHERIKKLVMGKIKRL